jgi:tetratricopeptide (TPR) repeat protein
MGDMTAQEQPDAARTWYAKAAGVLESASRLDERSTARFVEKMKKRGYAEDTIPDVSSGVVYTNLSLAYLRLQNFPLALEAYERLRRLAPTNVALYRDIGAIDVALGRTDDAAVALWQAVVLTEDVAAKQQLVEIYRAMPAGDTPIVTYGEAGEVQLQVGHPAVSAHRCRALRELVAILARALGRARGWGAGPTSGVRRRLSCAWSPPSSLQCGRVPSNWTAPVVARTPDDPLTGH